MDVALIGFDTYEDIKQIVYGTITEYERAGIFPLPGNWTLALSEEITERILDYLRASEGIPT